MKGHIKTPLGAAVLCLFLLFALHSASWAKDKTLLPGEKKQEEKIPGRYAVIFGVSKYKDRDLDLRFSRNDATAFYDFLMTPEGGGFEKDKVKLFLDQDATSSALRSALGTFLAKTSEEDLVFIYFSGHGSGTASNPQDLYLLTHEADPNDLAGTAFPMDEVKRYLEKSIKAKRVVVIADTCYAGGIKVMGGDGGIGSPVHSYLTRLSEARDGVLSITSSSSSQVSMEGTGYGKGHGVFTYYLLRGLREDSGLADENKDGIVDVAEAYEYLRQKVKEETKGRQIPDKTGDLMVGIPLAVVREGAKQTEPSRKPVKIVMGMFKDVPGGTPIKLRPGDALRSGDGYFFYLRSEKPVYLYLYQVDSKGASYRLFPNPKFHTSQNPVSAQKDLVLPNEKEVYFLDETTGQEEIYLFASNAKIPALEAMESGPIAELKQKGIRVVGRANVKPTESEVRTERVDFRGLLEEISAAGHFYHRMEIEHR